MLCQSMFLLACVSCVMADLTFSRRCVVEPFWSISFLLWWDVATGTLVLLHFSCQVQARQWHLHHSTSWLCLVRRQVWLAFGVKLANQMAFCACKQFETVHLDSVFSLYLCFMFWTQSHWVRVHDSGLLVSGWFAEQPNTLFCSTLHYRYYSIILVPQLFIVCICYCCLLSASAIVSFGRWVHHKGSPNI